MFEDEEKLIRTNYRLTDREAEEALCSLDELRRMVHDQKILLRDYTHIALLGKDGFRIHTIRLPITNGSATYRVKYPSCPRGYVEMGSVLPSHVPPATKTTGLMIVATALTVGLGLGLGLLYHFAV